MKPGIYEHSRAEYDAIEAMNWSTLCRGLDSMKHLEYAAQFIGKGGGRPDTDALRFGRLFHKAIFEPDDLLNEFTVFEGDRRSKTQKEKYQEIIDSGKAPIKSDEWDMCSDMRVAMESSPGAQSSLGIEGKNELTVVWIDRPTDILCKCRLDRLRTLPSPEWIVDPKTTTYKADMSSFQREIRRLHYYIQAAYYCDGYRTATGNAVGWDWLVIEKRRPYVSSVFTASEAMLLEGRKAYRILLDAYAGCKASGEWPGYYDQAVEIDLPEWMTAEKEPEPEELEAEYAF